MKSTLPIWLWTLFIGGGILMVMGHANIYITRSQKLRAKEYATHNLLDHDGRIIYDRRFNKVVFLAISAITIISSMCAFGFEDFRYLIAAVPSGDTFGLISVVLRCLLIYAIVGLFVFGLPFMTEMISLENQRSYYWRRYRVELIDRDEHEYDHHFTTYE